jgi:transposase
VERKLWGFTFTLGYSRMMMAEAALDQKLGTLLRMHEEAFRQLGGVPEEIFYDFVPGHKIRVLLRAALCGLGCARARGDMCAGRVADT